MRDGFLTNRDVALIAQLGREGRSRQYIAAAIGCSGPTISHYAPGLHLRRQRARQDRLLRAYDAAPRGGRAPVARRFGFRTVASLHVAVHRIRRRRFATTEVST